MPKFTFIADHSCDLDTHVVTHQWNGEYLYDVLEQFQMFLKGAGYNFEGDLDFVTDRTQHSQHYFDKDRNK